MKLENIAIILSIAFLFVAAYFLFGGSREQLIEESFTQEENEAAYLRAGNVEINLEVASSRQARAQGLSGRNELPVGYGMLFIFPESGSHGIWMKSMKFPIDIIWLDGNLRIVTVEENVSPATYPKVFYPKESAIYVLELPAGESAQLGLKEGLIADIHFSSDNILEKP